MGSLEILLLFTGLAGLVGIVLGYFIRWAITFGKKGSAELKIQQMLLDAQKEAKKVVSEAEKKADEIEKQAKEEEKEKEAQFKKTEDRLIKKEELLDKRQVDLKSDEEAMKQTRTKIDKEKEEIDAIRNQEKEKLEKLAKISTEEAKEMLLKIAEKNNEEDIAVRMQKLEMMGEEKLERKAKEILTSAIHRMGNSVASDVLSTTISIPSDDIKGKIIGKEGKNIRAFEQATGVELVVDDTPGAITISSFDPIRRQIARVALEDLIIDGRIQPARIEKIAEEAKGKINKIIKEKGEQAVYECGIYNLDPRIISILGRLHFRTSYGQNVLQHSIEMSHIAGVIAQELGANVEVTKAAALLHDIGKAVDHEIQGTHTEIGKRILQKFGSNEEIITAMESHHEETPFKSIEAVIVQVADSISGSRPGARRDTIENYLKRLGDLEAIANSFNGIERSYALQAGREIRIFVKPEEITDLDAKKLAREIALKIEKDLKYPGEIKVNVIRDSRTIEYAR
ncbi:ribonuclease Y [Patescibacteria group bacterium]|nr:ribonuclease Y [Patescibacteria group bacterium]MCG2695120.1 ribonuclease Y [Candidatus Parcubacteria bacterium]